MVVIIDKTPIEYRRALAEYVTNPETIPSWVSPVGVEASREYLTELPGRYDTVEEGYRFADIGSGDGTLTVSLAEEYPEAEVVGIDVAPTYTQKAVEEYREDTDRDNAKAIGGDVYDVLPELGPFDFIYAVNVMQDLPDFETAVETITDATRGEAYIGATFTGNKAKHLFEDFLRYDEEEDAEFWEFENVELDDDMAVSFDQRIIPESEAVSTFGEYGFEPVERKDLEADDEYLEQAMDLLDPDNERDTDEMSPAYPFYLFRGVRSDGE